ncbi:phosphotransferase family protein [Streptomyces silvensis]|uniref:Aminoglycoside phosphotransferase n=1 Tax=Streptomyces silvensis TaxID=1765722 RepID=A0A0W7X3I1_9ACTN|nr:aminoglycoside phosphotransferase family protein [Streptomyces silvensis]KUF17336.1 aminoglycoside phosphotransferase [Streptomyces silvensis]
MTTPRTEQSFAVLRTIAEVAGLTLDGAEPIRLAENDLWRLKDVVVRIARAGQEAAAAREVAVARWLAQHNIPAVRPMSWDQPVHAGGRAATFWELLPPHRHGTEADLAPLLRQMHELPTPSFSIGRLQPFVRIAERLAAANSVSDDDRQWLLDRLSELQQQWSNLPAGRPHCVIHGDAWGGNCAVTDQTAHLMDFERTSLGPPEWDLTSAAVAFETFGTISAERYTAYCAAYGYDVRNWAGYPTLRGIRELRLVTFALQIAEHDADALEQAHYRLECLRGLRGLRPWRWQAVGL